jgi:cytochrome c oxidase subunit 1
MSSTQHAPTDHAHGEHAAHGDHGHHEMTFSEKYLFPTDHKYIAKQYMLTGLFMAVFAGFFAYVFRMQLAFPGMSVPLYGMVSPAEYNSLVTQHGTIMVFWVAMPVLVAAFGNFCIPLMIGADDMVFPRLNRLSYQLFLISALVLIYSWFVPNGGFG